MPALAISRTLLSIEQAAELFGVAPKTIRRRIADGTLPAFRMGRQIRIDMAAAERSLLKPMNDAARRLLKAGDAA